QPRKYLAQRSLRDRCIVRVEAERFDGAGGVADRKGEELTDGMATESHGAGLCREALAAAVGARDLAHAVGHAAVAGFEETGEQGVDAVLAFEDGVAVALSEPSHGPVERHTGAGQRAEEACLLRRVLRKLQRTYGAVAEAARGIEDRVGI